MVLLSADTLALERSEQIVSIRQTVRERAVELGFSLVDQTKIVTAASELARNTVQHGGGGHAIVEAVSDGVRRGLRLTFEDHPAIAAELQALVEVENQCCSWAAWSVERSEDGQLVMAARSQGEGIVTLHGMLATGTSWKSGAV